MGELAATDVWKTRKPRNTMTMRLHLSPEPAGRNTEKSPMIDMMITGTIILNLQSMTTESEQSVYCIF